MRQLRFPNGVVEKHLDLGMCEKDFEVGVILEHQLGDLGPVLKGTAKAIRGLYHRGQIPSASRRLSLPREDGKIEALEQDWRRFAEEPALSIDKVGLSADDRNCLGTLCLHFDPQPVGIFLLDGD